MEEETKGKSIEELAKEKEVEQFDEYRIGLMKSIRKRERYFKSQLKAIEDDKVKLTDMNIDEYLNIYYDDSSYDLNTQCIMTGTIK